MTGIAAAPAARRRNARRGSFRFAMVGSPAPWRQGADGFNQEKLMTLDARRRHVAAAENEGPSTRVTMAALLSGYLVARSRERYLSRRAGQGVPSLRGVPTGPAAAVAVWQLQPLVIRP